MGCCTSTEAAVDFDAEVNFNHFRVLRSIGRGAFGKVCIVERRDTRKQFAMKYINKKNCIESKSGANTLREQEILAAVDGSCPFIVNLWYAFQDCEDLFFVVDYMAGGDLSFHLRQAVFEEDRVRLYWCEIALALAYLHANKIIHRDVKPENVLLDSNGHVHVTDFNVAFMYKDESNKKPRAIAGTRPYMAPEMLVGGGRSSYSEAVDWWSLGISMYECAVGKLPYHIPSSGSEQEIRDYFRSSKLTFPSSLSRNCCHAIQQFLRMTVSRRVQTMDAMKELDFFKDIDFDAVHRLEVQPTFIPQANLMNCDPMHELEEMIVEPQPLHKKKKRLKSKKGGDEPGDEQFNEDLTRLETKFFSYDRLRGGRIGSGATDGPSEDPEGIHRTTSVSVHSLDLSRQGSVASTGAVSTPVTDDTSPNHQGVRAGSTAGFKAVEEESDLKVRPIGGESACEVKSLTSNRCPSDGGLTSTICTPSSLPLENHDTNSVSTSLQGAGLALVEKVSAEGRQSDGVPSTASSLMPAHVRNLDSRSESSMIPMVDEVELAAAKQRCADAVSDLVEPPASNDRAQSTTDSSQPVFDEALSIMSADPCHDSIAASEASSLAPHPRHADVAEAVKDEAADVSEPTSSDVAEPMATEEDITGTAEPMVTEEDITGTAEPMVTEEDITGTAEPENPAPCESPPPFQSNV